MMKKIGVIIVVFVGCAVGCVRDETALLDLSSIHGKSSRKKIQRILAKSIVGNTEINIDCMAEDGRTPLMKATESRRDHVVKLLLRAGALPSIACQNKTALALLFEQAARAKHHDLDIRYAIAYQLLDAEHDPISVDGYLSQEERQHRCDILGELILQARVRISHEHAIENSVLLVLAESGDTDLVKTYLSKAVTSDVLVDAVRQAKVTAIQTLMRTGVNPNYPSTKKEYPLLVALNLGRPEVLAALKEGGARWNLVDVYANRTLSSQVQDRLDQAAPDELEKLIAESVQIDGFQDMRTIALSHAINQGQVARAKKLLYVGQITKELFDQAWQRRLHPNGKLVIDAITTFPVNAAQAREWLAQAQEQERKVLEQQEEAQRKRREEECKRQAQEKHEEEERARRAYDPEKPWESDSWRDRYHYPIIQPDVPPAEPDRPTEEPAPSSDVPYDYSGNY